MFKNIHLITVPSPFASMIKPSGRRLSGVTSRVKRTHFREGEMEGVKLNHLSTHFGKSLYYLSPEIISPPPRPWKCVHFTLDVIQNLILSLEVIPLLENGTSHGSGDCVVLPGIPSISYVT